MGDDPVSSAGSVRSCSSAKSSRSRLSRSSSRKSMKNLYTKQKTQGGPLREFEEPQTKEEFIQKLEIVVQDVLEIKGIPYKTLGAEDMEDSDVDISDEDIEI